MKFRIIFIIMLLATPITGWAMQETVWDFRGGNLPGEWRVSGAEAPQLTSEGMRMTASQEDMAILTNLALPHPIEVLSIELSAASATISSLLWHRPGDEAGRLLQLPFEVAAGRQSMDLNVDSYPQWHRRTDVIGLQLPQGSDVVIHEIRFRHWNLLERASHAFASFWHFDRYTPLNINFLWGPLITFNPVGAAQLFTTLPPGGKSGMWLLYGILILAAAGLIAQYFWKTTEPRRLARIFLFFVAGAWFLFDLRMGTELLSYVKADYDQYLSQPLGSKTFRTYLNFNDIMEQSVPILQQEPSFALVKTPEAPIIAMVRYFAYPSVPEEASGPRDDVRYWLVFESPDAKVNDQGQLTVGGSPWTKPGKIIAQYDLTSFLFEVNSTEP